MKYLYLFLGCGLSLISSAQNVQLHYDFGKQEDGTKRNFAVSTFEFFKPDSLGYTFMFTDFEFNSVDEPKGASLGYFELARSFYIPGLHKNRVLKNLLFHIEYNDGLIIYPDMNSDTLIVGENLRSSWLGGPEYQFNLGNLSLNLMVLCKYMRGSSAPDGQITLVWYYPVLQNKISFTGYIDVWSQNYFFAGTDSKIVAVYSEPQLWYNFNSHFSLGSELKISKNFVFGSNRIELFPTLGIKWQF